MTLFSNHSKDFVIASELTAVGDFLASMGPPIIVIVTGVFSPLLAINEIAAKTGTVG